MSELNFIAWWQLISIRSHIKTHKLFHSVLSHLLHRLVEVEVSLSQSQGLGLTIVSGRGLQNGDVPMYVKCILPSSVLEADGKLNSGDELVSVNEILLVIHIDR